MQNCWKEDEIEYLKNNYKISNKSILLENLKNRSWRGICGEANKLGLKRVWIWDDEKIEILKINYETCEWDSLLKMLGNANKATVEAKASQLGLKRGWVWTNERDNILREYYPNYSWVIICDKLSYCNKKAIRTRAYRLKIKRIYVNKNKKYKNSYTQEEINFIIENKDNLTFKEMSENINRNPDSIERMHRKLGFEIYDVWDENEIEILKKYFPKYQTKRLKDLFFKNRSECSIKHKAHDLMLKKEDYILDKNDKIVKNGQKKVQGNILEQLKDLSEILGRTPIHLDLKNFNLPSFNTYARAYGSYSKACELAGLEPNYSFIGCGTRSVHRSKNNDICFSICEVIITDFFIDNNIFYKKEEFYKDYINDKRCLAKKVDWVIGDDVFVEFFGFPKLDWYCKRMKKKISICKENNVELIDLYQEDLNKLETIFQNFIN